MGVHIAQNYVYAGTGEQAWFADLDPKCQLQDQTGSTQGDNDANQSYRVALTRMFVKPVANKTRILKYRLKHLKTFFSKSSKPEEHGSTIKWAEPELEYQEQEARERHGPQECTVYQVAQARIRVQKLRKKYLRKKKKQQMKTKRRLISRGRYIGW